MSSIRPGSDWSRGQIVHLQHCSEVLADNPWNDPVDRTVSVYLPAGHSEQSAPVPSLWDLAAYTNSGPGHLNWRNHGENLPARLDRLIGTGAMPPVAVIFPDCYTSLGGNQYVNSASVGRYADYLVQELVPFVEAQLNLATGREGRAVFGKSSGGYGALFHVMRHADTWSAAASHAGDAGFDQVFRPEFPTACSVLEQYDGNAEAFMRAFWRKNRLSGRDFTALMVLAMAASYDPDPTNPTSIRLPFDLRTCSLDAERWSRWLAYDPVEMVDECLAALKSLNGLYIDVGRYDQYRIHFGNRLLHDRLRGHGIEHHYEEFEGSHTGIDWRLDHSLPFLAGSLHEALKKR